MKLSILIVSYNVRDLLDRCLRSLGNIPEDWEVIVVDNNSKDGTRERITNHESRVTNFKGFCLSQNVGFSKGNIEAYKHASGEYILLLNPDTKVLPNAIATMVRYLDEHPRASILGPKLLNEDGSIQRSVRGFPTLVSQILILLKLHNYYSSTFESLKHYLLPDFDYSKTQSVDQVMGAALMTRRSTIEDLGFLDPGYKRIFEEVDFCYRVKKSGGEVAYLPEARIVHSKGQSFGNSMKFSQMLKKQYYFNQGMLRFFSKHRPLWQTIALVPFLLVSLCVTAVVWVLLRLRVPVVKNQEW